MVGTPDHRSQYDVDYYIMIAYSPSGEPGQSILTRMMSHTKRGVLSLSVWEALLAACIA